MRLLSAAIHRTLARCGYWVRHRSALPFGIDYQHDIRRLSKALAIPIDIFFDAGAHIGETAREAVKKFPKARVFSFEPHPATFAELARATARHKFAAFNLALSDKTGRAPFYDYGPLATSNSLAADAPYAVHAGHPARVAEVEAITVDDFCRRQDIGRVDVLKIDTEGHELAVLRGAAALLARGHPMFVYAEFNTVLPTQGTTGGALAPLGALLEPLGFRFVATYPAHMTAEGGLFVACNVLYVRPPRG